MTDEPLSAYVRRTGCDEMSKDAIADRIARMEEALVALTFYLAPPHRRIGIACGLDACIACLAESTVQEALAETTA